MINRVSKEEFLKLCHLSRLEFNDDEVPKLMESMDSIINFSSKISEYEDSSITPDCNVNFDSRGLSDIKYEKCDRDELLSGGTNRDGFFFVKNNSN